MTMGHTAERKWFLFMPRSRKRFSTAYSNVFQMKLAQNNVTFGDNQHEYMDSGRADRAAGDDVSIVLVTNIACR